ncbi:MAG: sulfatase-like hydrolase/transferase, partial [Acidobacteriota bacterium]|nr:sulfatase-like hydrolase/transferase [Acidobacteriota bacterium]
NNGDEDEQDGRVARRVAGLLRENKDKPFFIAAGLHKPHLPWVAPKKYFEMYPPSAIQLPKESPEDLKNKPAEALRYNRHDENLTEEGKRQAVAAYYASVSFMDAQVGVLLDAMDELKLWDSTVVVFFGDHGFHLGEHGGLWRKLTLFEESARAPLIVHAPDKGEGKTSNRLVEFVDFYPTLTELCGLPAPPGMEGTSFVPLLTDQTRPWKKAVFIQVPRGRNVRTETHSYTEWDEGRAVELYDHRFDPREYRNLADDPRHTGVRQEMQELLRGGWQAVVPVARPRAARP